MFPESKAGHFMKQSIRIAAQGTWKIRATNFISATNFPFNLHGEKKLNFEAALEISIPHLQKVCTQGADYKGSLLTLQVKVSFKQQL